MLTRVFSLIVAFSATTSNACETSFDAALEKNIAAVKARDLDAYMSTIAPRSEQLMILPNGDVWQSTDEIRVGHAAWFADKTWRFETVLIRKDVRQHWGVATYQVSVNRPEKPGAPFLLSMVYAPEKDGCWYLQHDQNTLLPKMPKDGNVEK